jgi:hypothetical protein
MWNNNRFFKIFHTVVMAKFPSKMTRYLDDFRGLRTAKVCHTFSIVSSATQSRPWPGPMWDTQPVSTNRLHHAKIVVLLGFFCDNWSWIFSEREVGDGDSWNHKQHCAHSTLVYDYMMTGWFLNSSVQVECHGGLNEILRTGHNFETYMTKLLLQVQKLWHQIFV